MFKRALAVMAAGMLLASPLRAGGAAAVKLTPHEAVYELRLASARHRAGLTAAKGRIVMSLRGGDCEGWSQTSRMMVRYVFRRRGEKVTDTRTASWEAADGTVFRYASSHYANGVKARETRLEARAAGEEASVRFSRPAKRKLKLPAGVVFPQASLRLILDAARAGRRRLSYMGYEGFDDGRARLIVVAIGAPAGGEARFPDLRKLRAWPVSFAYYPLADGRGKGGFGLPEYEVAMLLHENGAASRVSLIYPDMTLKGRLRDLKLLSAAPCR